MQVALAFVLLGIPVIATAQADLGFFDDVQQRLEATANSWRPVLESIARNLLLILAGLSITWQAILMVLRNSDLTELMTEIVKIIMYTGFFLTVIEYSASWCEAIVESFSQAALQAASSGKLTAVGVGPADTLRIGVQLANSLSDAVDWTQPFTYIFYVFAIFVVMIYAVISAYQMLVLAELYIVTAAGIVFLGFGGSVWSRDTAIRHIWYVISIAAKLYALYLTVGVGADVINTFIGIGEWSFSVAAAMLGMVLMVAILIITIPNVVQGLVSGSTIGGSAQAGYTMLNAATRLGAAAALLAQPGGRQMNTSVEITATANLNSTTEEAERAAGGSDAGSIDDKLKDMPPPPEQDAGANQNVADEMTDAEQEATQDLADAPDPPLLALPPAQPTPTKPHDQ